MRSCLIILTILLVAGNHLSAQDTSTFSPLQLPKRYIDAVSSKAKSIESKLDKKSEKALTQLQKQERKIQQKLGKLDSNAAKQLLENTTAQYKQIEEKLKNPGKFTQYMSLLDSTGTSLNFLNQNSQLLNQAKEIQYKLKDAIGKVDALKAQLQKAENIKQFLKARKQYLKQQLEKFGLTKQLKKINKTVYYASEQLREIKDAIQDPRKAERKVLELLSKTKIWKEFFRRNSALASLFRLPGNSNDPAAQASLAGLQTRLQVNNLIQQQITAGGPNAMQQFQQNLQSAQSQLNELKNKVLKFGGGSSDAAMPEGFKPNTQKVKSFKDRLNYEANIQSQKATNFFPVTSDLGLTVGYKLNDKSVFGIGASYKLGLGRGWNNIRFSSEGVGLRSFIDWKIKGSFWISGGYERNYRSAFQNFTQLRDKNGWQQSGLIGIQKKLSVKTKFFKQTSVRLLWDFLSYSQIPRAQPIIFRIGYNF